MTECIPVSYTHLDVYKRQAVEIEWLLDIPVREDLYEYIVNE